MNCSGTVTAVSTTVGFSAGRRAAVVTGTTGRGRASASCATLTAITGVARDGFTSSNNRNNIATLRGTRRGVTAIDSWTFRLSWPDYGICRPGGCIPTYSSTAGLGVARGCVSTRAVTTSGVATCGEATKGRSDGVSTISAGAVPAGAVATGPGPASGRSGTRICVPARSTGTTCSAISRIGCSTGGRATVATCCGRFSVTAPATYCTRFCVAAVTSNGIARNTGSSRSAGPSSTTAARIGAAAVGGSTGTTSARATKSETAGAIPAIATLVAPPHSVTAGSATSHGHTTRGCASRGIASV